VTLTQSRLPEGIMIQFAKPSTPIAYVRFVDGVARAVYLDENGGQFVLDDDGQPIFGVWIYIDEPEGSRCSSLSPFFA